MPDSIFSVNIVQCVTVLFCFCLCVCVSVCVCLGLTFWDPASSHPYHCKKGIPYSQDLRLNRICSDNENFYKRCNNLKKWLMERGTNEKMIGKQILRTQEDLRNDLVEREKPQMSEQKLTFSITYYPTLQFVVKSPSLAKRTKFRYKFLRNSLLSRWT